MSRTTLNRLSGVALMLAFVLSLVGGQLHPVIEHQSHTLATMGQATFPLAHLLIFFGGALLLIGLLFLAVPDVAIDSWPWTLTPLTARVTGAVLAMYGTVWLAVAVHHVWAGARIPLEAQTIGLAFLLLAIARGQDTVDWDNALAFVIVAAAAAMLMVSALLSRRAT